MVAVILTAHAERFIADMEFVTNFTGIGFWVMNFTLTNILNYGTFFLYNNLILMKK